MHLFSRSQVAPRAQALLLGMVLLGPSFVLGQGPPVEQKREPIAPPLLHQAPVLKPPLVERPFRGEIRRLLPRHVEVDVKDQAETVTLPVQEEWARQLKLNPGAVYQILAHQRHTPGGVTTAIKFHDDRGLYALAESIHDVQLFTPGEREGLEVEQQPQRARTFVYEDACKSVYNVPTEFMLGRERILMQPYETKQVELQGQSYTLTLNHSQFIVLKECPIPFEGGHSQVDYSLVRTAAAER